MKRSISVVLASAVAALAFCGAALAAKVNLNTADAETLAAGIDGVGPKIAERIIEWRDEFGPFENVDQLAEVRGIGEKTVEANRENLTVEASSE